MVFRTMITIIHGSDTTKSREYFLQERQKATNPILLEGDKFTQTDLAQAVSGNGLFDTQQEIFIENLLSRKKVSAELDAIVLALSRATGTITLWESKDLTAKQIGVFNNAQVKQFKIPSIVFTFVDSLAPKNSKKLISLFHQLLEQEDPIFALSMLQRQVRILLGLKDEYVSISEVSRLASWQLGKLKKQANLFETDELINLHNKLYELERGQKTGTLSLPLGDTIDFFLLSI